jgi:hypothetical protein
MAMAMISLSIWSHNLECSSHVALEKLCVHLLRISWNISCFIVDGLNLPLGVEPFFNIFYKSRLILHPNIFHQIFYFLSENNILGFLFLGENFNISENNIISVELV